MDFNGLTMNSNLQLHRIQINSFSHFTTEWTFVTEVNLIERNQFYVEWEQQTEPTEITINRFVNHMVNRVIENGNFTRNKVYVKYSCPWKYWNIEYERCVFIITSKQIWWFYKKSPWSIPNRNYWKINKKINDSNFQYILILWTWFMLKYNWE